MERVHSWRRPGPSGVLYRADASEFLASQRSEAADLVFLDPPFNLGKKYSAGHPRLDRRASRDYRRWLSSILLEAVRVLAPGGSLFLYHLPEWAVRAAGELERHLNFRHWIAISMKNGFARGKKLYPAHYALLYYTKGVPLSFTRPRLTPQLCRHCKKLVRDYGGYTSIIEEKGVNLSDVWDDISPVRHAAKKHRDANELPATITDRVAAIAGFDGGRFLDPFAGAGSAVISAASVGMRFRAADLLAENCALVARRVDELKLAKSRLRRGLG